MWVLKPALQIEGLLMHPRYADGHAQLCFLLSDHTQKPGRGSAHPKPLPDTIPTPMAEALIHAVPRAELV